MTYPAPSDEEKAKLSVVQPPVAPPYKEFIERRRWVACVFGLRLSDRSSCQRGARPFRVRAGAVSNNR
jgi:hypothetical protein